MVTKNNKMNKKMKMKRSKKINNVGKTVKRNIKMRNKKNRKIHHGKKGSISKMQKHSSFGGIVDYFRKKFRKEPSKEDYLKRYREERKNFQPYWNSFKPVQA